MAPAAVRFHPAAAQEAESTYEWYAERNPQRRTAFVKNCEWHRDHCGGPRSAPAGLLAVTTLIGPLTSARRRPAARPEHRDGGCGRATGGPDASVCGGLGSLRERLPRQCPRTHGAPAHSG